MILCLIELMRIQNKVFWATGIQPFIPSALRPKRKFVTRTNDKRDLEIR